MNTYTFRLDEYFNKTQKCYYFIDGLFNYTKLLKKDVFKIVDIYDTSYRTDRLKENVKNNNRSIILKYFKYNMLDKSYQHKYEVCISKIYYCVYFSKIDKIKELLEELEIYINHNNCIKPILILFKVFALLSLHKNKKTLDSVVQDEISYLHSFEKTKYFIDEISYLYYAILFYFNKLDNMILLDDYANKYPWLSWFDYNLRANLFYMDSNDAEAAIYYSAALEEYKENYNMEKVLRMTNNLSYTYNLLGKYQFSLKVSQKIIKYAFNQEVSKLVKSITMHYLFSNFMLNRYQEILNFYDVVVFNDENLNTTSKIILMLSAWKSNQLYRINQLLDKEEDNILFTYFKNIVTRNLQNQVNIDDVTVSPYIGTICNLIN